LFFILNNKKEFSLEMANSDTAIEEGSQRAQHEKIREAQKQEILNGFAKFFFGVSDWTKVCNEWDGKDERDFTLQRKDLEGLAKDLAETIERTSSIRQH